MNIHCPCGNLITEVEIPCKTEIHLLRDAEVEATVGDVREAVRQAVDVEARIGYAVMKRAVSAHECPKCGRLLVFWGGAKSQARSYRPE